MNWQAEKEKWISWLQKLKGPQKITIGPITPQTTPPQSNSPKIPANHPKTPTPTRDSNLTNSSGPGSNQTSPASRKGTIGGGAPPLQRRPSTSSNPAGTAGPATPERVLIGGKGQRQSAQFSPVNSNSGPNSLNSSSNDVKPQIDVSLPLTRVIQRSYEFDTYSWQVLDISKYY